MSLMIVEVAISIAIPVMIVFNTTAVSFPIPRIESFAVMSRCDPASTLVWWSSPVTLMPLVVLSYGIPITLYPHAFRTWPYRHHYNCAGRRWCSDYKSNGNLRVNGRSRGEQYGSKKCGPHEDPHLVQPSVALSYPQSAAK
jgi:hypothetical protein